MFSLADSFGDKIIAIRAPKTPRLVFSYKRNIDFISTAELHGPFNKLFIFSFLHTFVDKWRQNVDVLAAILQLVRTAL